MENSRKLIFHATRVLVVEWSGGLSIPQSVVNIVKVENPWAGPPSSAAAAYVIHSCIHQQQFGLGLTADGYKMLGLRAGYP